jgi:hypothetical protein
MKKNKNHGGTRSFDLIIVFFSVRLLDKKPQAFYHNSVVKFLWQFNQDGNFHRYAVWLSIQRFSKREP